MNNETKYPFTSVHVLSNLHSEYVVFFVKCTYMRSNIYDNTHKYELHIIN